MVDADSQCNLTGLSMGLMPADFSAGEVEELADEEVEAASAEFEKTQVRASEFWQTVSERNIHNALRPAFFSEPKPLEAVDCIPIERCPGLFLLPGSLNFADYESDLSLAQSLRGVFGSQRNLPGAIHALLKLTAEKMEADYVIVDVSPSLGAINQNIVTISDEVIIPCAPDYFSVMALNSLAGVLSKWLQWAREAYESKELSMAPYPFPKPRLKFAGVIISRYVVYKKQPAGAFSLWIKKVAETCQNDLVPGLREYGLTYSDSEYRDSFGRDDYVAALIREFNSLRPRSQENQIPVFALEREHLRGIGGQSLYNTEIQIKDLDNQYERFADSIIALTD